MGCFAKRYSPTVLATPMIWVFRCDDIALYSCLVNICLSGNQRAENLLYAPFVWKNS